MKNIKEKGTEAKAAMRRGVALLSPPDNLFEGNPAKNNLTGKRIGLLTVISAAGRIKGSRKIGSYVIWKCKCDCGNMVYVNQVELVSRDRPTRSCGCLKNIFGQKHKSWKGYKSISRTYWSRLIKQAKSRGFAVDISIKQAWSLWVKQKGLCALTGKPMELKRIRGTASLDRIDSSLGYIKGNVQWVLCAINKMKWNLSQDQFISLCVAVADNQKIHEQDHSQSG